MINESFLGRVNDQEPMLDFARNDFQKPNKVQISKQEARIILEPFFEFRTCRPAGRFVISGLFGSCFLHLGISAALVILREVMFPDGSGDISFPLIRHSGITRFAYRIEPGFMIHIAF